MNIVLYIARRYVFTKNAQNAINIINNISALVLIIGTACLFIVLSGFQGLKNVGLSMINDVTPDIEITPSQGKYFDYSQDQQTRVQQIKGVAQVSKVIEEKAFLSNKNFSYIATIKGVDKQYPQIIPVDEYVYKGRWSITKYYATVGREIAKKLELKIFDENHILQVMIPKSGKDNIANISADKSYRELFLSAAGIYSINEEIDKQYIYSNIANVQKLLGLGHNVLSALEFKVSDINNVSAIKKELKAIFQDEFLVKDCIEQNATLYKMLNIENMIIYMIFTLILIIALFNLAGAVNMMIIEKKSNLQTLLYLGMPIHKIRQIFILQGLLVVAISAVIGLLIGFVLCVLQQSFEFLEMNPDQPYPLEMRWIDVWSVLSIVCVLGATICWLVSKKIDLALFDKN